MKKYMFFGLLMTLFFGTLSSVFADDPVWKVVELKDEFGDLTGDKRIVATAQGTFSNTATSNSLLFVSFFVDSAKECDLQFYEYGRTPAASFYNDTFSFTIKDGAGEKKTFRWSSPKYSSKYISVGKDLLPILKQGGIIKFVVIEGASSYVFEINATEFPELFSKTFLIK